MLLKDFLKEDRIVIPEEDGIKRRLIPKDMIERFEAIKELDASASKQIELGLGVPRTDLNHDLEKVRKEIYQYNRSRLLKAGYKIVINPPEEFFPRFNTSGNAVKGQFNKVPLLAMVHLTKGLAKIRCSLSDGQQYEAPIPKFPAEAVKEAQKVRELAPNAEFHLCFMPSWKNIPQRDPVLLAKVQGKFFYVHGWDGDKHLIDVILKGRKKVQV